MATPIPRVSLRDATEHDLPILFQHQADAEAARIAAFPSRDFTAFVKHWTNVLADSSVHKKVIVADGVVAGHIGIFGQDGEREVGYWIGREHWGKGIATLALREILQIVLERPLYAHVAAHNLASIRVLEKCGFLRVGEDPTFSAVDGSCVKGFVFRFD